MSIDVTAATTLTLNEIMRRPFQALTIRELDALDALEQVSSNAQGESS